MEPRIWSFEWNDAMSVGIPEIDENHKRFIALVDAFNESVAGHMTITEVQKRLVDILDDAVQHFAREERLFKEFRYPGADHHARIHAQLVSLLQHIKSTISYVVDQECIEAALKIKEALITHIHTEDMKYAEFYRNSRGAPTAGGR
jgi:hemerythrin-like metal-binding protein